MTRHLGAGVVFGLVAAGCPGAEPMAAGCAHFFVDDASMVIDPAFVYPGTDFELAWNERYTVQGGGAAPAFDEVREKLQLLDPDTSEQLFAMDRIVPAPEQANSGGTPASIGFAEIAAQPTFDPVPRDYLFTVELHELPGAGIECPPDVEYDGSGEILLELNCSCDGYAFYNLRIADAGTNPPTPIAQGSDIYLNWTVTYEGTACPDAAPLSSGDFQASVVITSNSGSTEPYFVPVPSMPVGTTANFSVPVLDIVSEPRPIGLYTATIALDPDGAVDECVNTGATDASDQAAVISFEVE